jgi:hypothetical protein
MAIKPPSWAKNAIPTARGWQDPRTNELLKSAKLLQADIDSYLGTAPAAPAPVVAAPVDAVNEWQDEDVDGDGEISDLEKMSKIELEALGREHGVELDRRKSRKSLLGQMKDLLN